METSGNKVCDDAPKFLEFLYFQAVFLYFVKSVFPPNRVTRRRDIQCPTGTRTRPATRYFLRYPTRFNFENHRVAGNPKYRVLPDISGNTRSFGYYPKFWVLPDISGCKLFVNYPEYPEIPGLAK